MLKRMGLYLLTNIAILAVISILLRIFNVAPYLTQQGLDYQSLLVFSLIVGFSGSIISLLISKKIAKFAYKVKIIKQPQGELESWLVSTIQQLANRLGIGMPEIGIYDSPEPNAFATGWSRNNALVAVSTGILQLMDRAELESVLGHELSHVANGDMVTLTLIQGVINTFVIFLSRIAAYALMAFLRRGEGSRQIGGFAYYGVALLFQLVFGFIASLIVMKFSRFREYRADRGSAKLLGKDNMIAALQKLQQAQELPVDNRAPAMDLFKINHRGRFSQLFSSHPPLATRINVLQNMSGS